MISILIPTYNTDCLRLVADVQKQCEELQAQYGEEGFDYEMLVCEDASTDESTVERNEMIELLPNCTHLRLTENVGRAAVRNYLIEQSRFPYVLLMDADAEICTDDFVLTYWQQRDAADVLIGSITNLAQAPPGCELRWRYEIQAERHRNLAERRSHPTAEFTVFNAFFRRTVFDRVRFDDVRCKDYGYEDALFGLDVESAGFSILPIDNPLRHIGIHSNEVFLRQTESALRTLARLGAPMTERAKVSRTWTRLRKWRLNGLFRVFFNQAKSLLRLNLLSQRPILLLFSLYKLGVYDEIMGSSMRNTVPSPGAERSTKIRP